MHSAPSGQEENTVSQYVQVGALFTTVPNLIVIACMLVVFGIGLWAKLPSDEQE